MYARRVLPALLVATMLVAPALASPAPVSACPPCDRGFTNAAASHGVATSVAESEATVRVHENGSATWTVRVVPTNESALTRLAENESLALAVAGDSFGVRYGDGIDHELLGADMVDGAFVMEYRTLDVVERGPLGTHVLTYFRDSPGAYVYTDLGADELTVIAPDGMTVARGFGEVSADRMTATALAETRNGPFVVFAPDGTPLPGLVGSLAVGSVLGDVILVNALLFVAVPGAVLVSGIATIRRFVGTGASRGPTRLGAGVATGGAVLVVGTLVSEMDAFPDMFANAGVGVIGLTLSAIGASVAVPSIRRHVTPRRLAGATVVVAAIAFVLADRSAFHRSLSLGAALLPGVTGLGWADARAGPGRPGSSRFFVPLAVAIVVALAVAAPLTALGGSFFLLAPILLTAAAAGFLIPAAVLYRLGAAAASVERSETASTTAE